MSTEVFAQGQDIAEEMFDVVAESRRRGRTVVDDPYPLWAEHRQRGSVHPGFAVELLGLRPTEALFEVKRPHYAVLGFDDCHRALVNNDIFSSSFYDEFLPSKAFGRTILHMGGEEHRRYRNIVQPHFIRQQATAWWQGAWIEPIVAELIAMIENQKSVDLSKTLCARLPMHTITRAFGMADERAIEFRYNLLRNMSSEDPEERAASDTYIRRVLQEEIEARKARPRDDLISVLLHSEFKDADGDPARLDEEEIYSFCRVVMTAGGGTTFRQLGITLVALLSDPEQLEAVRRDRSLIERAIHESLRWNTTLPIFHRLVTEDTDLGGVLIPEGSVVDLCLGAANRDPARWEAPECYDLHRPVQRHLGFAGGPHTCLGMFVAQGEMTVAINALLDRFPSLRFDPDFAAPAISGSPELRGVSHLNVRLDG